MDALNTAMNARIDNLLGHLYLVLKQYGLKNVLGAKCLSLEALRQW